MKDLPRVVAYELEDEQGLFYAVSEKNGYVSGVLLSATTGAVVGEEAVIPVDNTKTYLGNIIPAWHDLIDRYKEKVMILNSPTPVEDYLALRNDRLREEKRKMETDSEPFTITEAEDVSEEKVEPLNWGVSVKGLSALAEVERLGNIIAENVQYIKEVESENEFLRNKCNEQCVIITYLEEN